MRPGNHNGIHFPAVSERNEAVSVQKGTGMKHVSVIQMGCAYVVRARGFGFVTCSGPMSCSEAERLAAELRGSV